MKNNTIKAIAFDMDGTLLTDAKEVSPRTRRCFELLEDRGVSLILSTGRSYEALEPYKKDLNLNHPVICYNGAQVYSRKGSILQSHLVPDDISRQIIDFAKKKKVHVQIYRKGMLYFEERTPEADFYEKHISLKGHCVNFNDFDSLLITKIMYLGDHELLDRLKSEIKGVWGDKLTVMFSNPIFLEIMDGKVSKGNALSEIADHLGIETSNIMAFGDGDNDKSMIETVGIGVAMENASEGVKSVANEVTLSNNDDGVAEFLEDFFGLRL